MSGYAAIAYGTTSAGFGTPFTLAPTVPAGPVAGNLLIMYTGIQYGSSASPVISGWTNLSTVSGETGQQSCIAVYGRIMTGSGDAPTFNWAQNLFAFAFIVGYSGNPATLTGILAVPAALGFNTISNSSVLMPTVSAPPVNGCLAIAVGLKNTGLTTNPTWTQFGSFQNEKTVFTSGEYAGIYADWVQTTATGVTGGAWSHNTPNDTGSETNGTRIIMLLPPGGTDTPIQPPTGSLGAAGVAPTLSTHGGTIITPNTCQ